MFAGNDRLKAFSSRDGRLEECHPNNNRFADILSQKWEVGSLQS